MGFVTVAGGMVFEIAESRKDAVDLIAAGQDKANLTVASKPMTFYKTQIVAIAETQAQMQIVPVPPTAQMVPDG